MADKKTFTINVNGIDKAYKDVVKLKDVLKSLEKTNINVNGNAISTINSLNQNIGNLNSNVAGLSQNIETLNTTNRELIQTYNDLGSSITGANQTIEQNATETAHAEGSIDKLKKSLKKLQEQYDALSEADRKAGEGKKLLQQINQLTGQIDVAINRTHKLVSGFSNLTSAFNDYGTSMSNVSSIFSEANSILNTFGIESNKITEGLNTLQKVIAIVSSVQKIMNTVNTIATVVQKGFNQAVKSNPLMALLSVLIAVVTAIYGFVTATEKASDASDKNADASDKMNKKIEETNELYKKAGEAAGSTKQAYEELRKEWLKLKTEKEKNQFLKDNKEKFEKLGVEINNVNDAENVLIKNTEAFIASMNARAKVLAAQNILIKKQEELVTAQIKQEAELKELQEKNPGLAKKYKEYLGEEYTIISPEVEQAKKDIDDLNKYMDDNAKEYNEALKKGGMVLSTNKKTLTGSGKKDDKVEKQKKANEELLKQEEEYQNQLKKLRDEGVQRKVKDDLSNSKDDIERLKVAQQEELNLKIKFQEEELTAEDKKYKKLVDDSEKLAREAGLSEEKIHEKREEIKKQWLERKALLEIKQAKDNENLTQEHLETLRNLEEGALKEKLSEEKKITEKHYQEIQELKTNATVKKDNGLLDVEETRKNLTEIKGLLSAYQIELDASYTKRKELFDQQLALYAEDSKEYKDILEQKTASDKEYAKKNKDANKAIGENAKSLANVQSEYFKSLSEKMTEVWGNINQGLTAAVGAMTSILDQQLNGIKEKLDETTKQYDVIVAKKKESDDKIKSLEEEAKNVSGGRAIVLQEQIARQMDSNAELAKQEKELAKEKEKIEKEQAKKEKQKKKIELAQKLVTGIADTATAVLKALALGPWIGPIFAGIAAASGAIQTAVIVKQMSKLEDGGLLQGKRHKQGGMRIEGTNIEVEGDEYVVNRISTRKNLGLISYINKNRKELSPDDVNNYFMRTGNGSQAERSFSTRQMYQDGGQLTNLEVMDAMNAPNNDKILEAISQINFKPVVSVVDIASAQSNVTEVKDIAGV